MPRSWPPFENWTNNVANKKRIQISWLKLYLPIIIPRHFSTSQFTEEFGKTRRSYFSYPTVESFVLRAVEKMFSSQASGQVVFVASFENSSQLVLQLLHINVESLSQISPHRSASKFENSHFYCKSLTSVVTRLPISKFSNSTIASSSK